jgi:hypothetical protein
VLTHRSQGDGGSCQSDQTTISGMGLVYGISIVMTELFDDSGNFLVLSSEDSIADDFL